MIELRPAKYLLGRLAPMDNNDKIPQFNLGAGTYNSTVYLRGDGVWANPLAGAGFVPLTRELTINGVTYDLSANRTWTIDTTSATWGNITGTLSNQTDLQNALNAKQDDITLTTIGTSGAATFVGNTLNIPQYSGALIGYVPYTGATTNVNLGEYGLSAGWVQIDTSPTTYTPGVGKLGWSSSDGTLEFQLVGGNVTLQIGQEQVARVVNKTDPSIDLLESNYQVVKVGGAQGNRLKVALAQANNDANSAETLGLVTEDIPRNQEGFITTSGIVRNINTTGSLQGETWLDGDMLFLSGTVAGKITKIKPSAPIHTVILGYVIRAHATQGQIYVKVDNGYELGELHDVNTNLSKTTPVDADSVLLQDTADSNIWKKLSWLNTKATLKTYFDTLYQVVGSYVPTSRTLTVNGTTYDLSANRSWTIDKASVGLGNVDNTSDLNKPISTATQTALNAKQDNITLTTTGTSGAATLVGATLNIPQYQSVITNPITGTGTTNYVSKFTGSGSIGDSLIFDNGTNVGIGTASPSAKLHIAGSEQLLDDGVNGRLTFGVYAGLNDIYSTTTSFGAYQNLRYTANDHIFRNAGTEVMRLTGGNVGIGTSNPTQKLDVNGGIRSSQYSLITNTYDGRGIYADDGGGSTIFSLTRQPSNEVRLQGYSTLTFFTDGSTGSEKMRITYDGKVGIGTTSPLQKLHVYGNIHMDGSQLRFPSGVNVLTLANVSGSWNSLQTQGINIGDWSSNPSYGDILIGDYSFDVIRTDGTNIFRVLNNGNAIIGQGLNRPVTYDSTGGNFRIKGNAGGWATGYFFDGSSGTFRGGFGAFGSNDLVNYYWIGDDYNIPTMMISPNQGRVAIGTITPQSKLDVTDWTTYISVSSAANSESTTDGQPLAGINFRKHYAIGIGASIKQLQAGGINNYSQAHLAFYTNDASIGWNDPVERMRITSGGNVGIGTGNPQNYGGLVSLTIGDNSSSKIGLLKLRSNYNGGDGAEFWQDSAGLLRINTNSSTIAMGITGGGNIGIGTTNPSQALDVNGYITSQRYYPYSSGGAYITGDTGGVVIDGSGYLYVTASAGSYFQTPVRFRSTIEDDSSPYLHVKGGTAGVTYFAGTIGVGGANVFHSSSIQVGNGIFYAKSNNSDIGGKIYGYWDTGYQPYAGGLKFQVFRLETGSYQMYDAMTLSGSGKVGIGTTSPNNKLTVNGGISGTPTWNNSTLELESNGGLTTSLAFHRAGYSVSCIYSDDGSLAFQVGGGEKIRITPYNTGIGTSSPNSSAVLDVASTTQGFLPPRMNDAEMNSILSPAAGLMVWNNDIGSIFVFDGGSWRKIAYA